MKRVYIASILLLLCFGFSLYSFLHISNACRKLIDIAETISAQAENADDPLLRQSTEALEALWRHNTAAFSLLTTHLHYDALEKCVDACRHACRNKDAKKIKSSCDDLIFEATHIITTIEPNLQNII